MHFCFFYLYFRLLHWRDLTGKALSYDWMSASQLTPLWGMIKPQLGFP